MTNVVYSKLPQVITGGPTVWWVSIYEDNRLSYFKWFPTEAEADVCIEADKARRQRIDAKATAQTGSNVEASA